MESKVSLEKCKNLVLYKLKNRGYWGRRLMNLGDLVQGVPKENHGLMEEAAESLYREGLLWRKPGNRKQFRYSLNPSKKKEIEGIIEEYLRKKGIEFRIMR